MRRIVELGAAAMAIRDERSTAELIAIAQMSKDDEECWPILSILQHRGSREVFDAAVELCKGEDLDDRILGVQILAQLGIPERSFPAETTALLLEMLERESDPMMLNNIGVAFGHLHSVEAIAPLTQLKDHPHEDVRFGVVYGLMCQEDELAIATLIELSADPSIAVRNWATFSLGSQIETDSPEIRQALWNRIKAEKPHIAKDEFYEIYGEAVVGLARRREHRILNLLTEELASDCIGDLLLEACEELADERLFSALVTAQAWLGDSDLLKQAIERCKPNRLEK